MPLKALILDHAEADANEAISHGDLRFLAVQGYSLEIPGVTGDVSKIEATYGIKFLSGTSDVIENNEHQRLDVNAREYALRYNKTLLANVPK
jgi:hypothetical protein